MKIQLKSLSVEACGPLRDVEISFLGDDGQPRPVTIIGGANGSGKTTVLELIFALMQLVYPQQFTNDIKSKDVLFRAKNANLELDIDDNEWIIAFGDEDYLATFSKLDNVKLILQKDNTFNKFKVNLFQEKINSQTHRQLVDIDRLEKMIMPSVLYFHAYRSLEQGIGQAINREELVYQWTYRYQTVKSFQGSLNSYLVWLDYAHPEQFMAVTRFLNQIVLTGKSIDHHINRPELTAMVKLSDGQTHRLDELSSGEQNLLIIMLELRRRLLPGSIVLIDEIENSLHPAFQHRLAEALLKLQREVPFQLIATTHAPAFLDVFGPESTLLLTEF